MDYTDSFDENLNANKSLLNQMVDEPSTIDDLLKGISADNIEGGVFGAFDKTTGVEFKVDKVSGLSYIQSRNFVTGVSGWRIDSNGNVEFGSGTFRGSITGSSLTIGTNAWHVDTSGNMWWGNYATFALAEAGKAPRISASGTVNASKLFFNGQFIYTAFDSLDAWQTNVSGAGLIAVYLGVLNLSTDVNLNDYAQAHITWASLDNITFAKNPSFQTVVFTGVATLQTIYFGIGHDLVGAVRDGFGFKITNGTLEAYTYGGGGSGEATSAITGITLTDKNEYRAEYSVSGAVVSFYVNGVLKTTLPISGIDATTTTIAFGYYIKTGTTAARGFSTKYLSFSQDN